MTAIFRPDLCECGGQLEFLRAQDAPGGYVYRCISPTCVHHGRLFKLPVYTTDPYVVSALLKPKIKVVG